MSDDVVEIDSHAMDLAKSGVDPDCIVVLERPKEIEPELKDGVHVAIGFDLAKGKSTVAQQGGSPELEEAEVIGVIHSAGAIRVGKQNPMRHAMPHQTTGLVAHVAVVLLMRSWLESGSAHGHTPRKMRQQLVPPNPKELDNTNS